MVETNVNNSTTTNLTSAVKNFSVSPKVIDEATGDKFYYYNDNFTRNNGYYKNIPELKRAIDSFSIWVAGLGFSTDDLTTAVLGRIRGNGSDTFDSIILNMIRVSKYAEASFAEIIRDPDQDETKITSLLNIKPLNPQNIRIEYNKKGIITAFEEYNIETKEVYKRFKPKQILYLPNDRVANEVHGTSVIEACKWVIDARNEAMNDWRRVLHRSSVRVLYVDLDDTTKLNSLKTQYAEAVKQGEVLILPVKRGDAELADYTAPPIQAYLEWIQYLENFFWLAVGIPKIIGGDSSSYSEASSKMAHFTFEQPHKTERRLLEQQLRLQLGIEVDFDEPTSIKTDMQTSEAANTGQMGIQPNDTQMQVGRTT